MQTMLNLGIVYESLFEWKKAFNFYEKAHKNSLKSLG